MTTSRLFSFRGREPIMNRAMAALWQDALDLLNDTWRISRVLINTGNMYSLLKALADTMSCGKIWSVSRQEAQ
jgi:hypothetical protein